MKLRKINLWLIMLTTVLLLAGCGQKQEISLEQISEEAAKQTSEKETSEQTEEAETPKKPKNMICIHVCGAVEHPGVYEIPEGSRNDDAVKAAGGFRENASTDYLNMAKIVEDGTRLEIPTLKQVQDAKAGGYLLLEDGTIQSGSSSEDGLVNINTAEADALTSLPGVGMSRAEGIVAYREEHGDFKKIEDIMQVSGIKEGLYAKIESYITVD